MHIPYTFRGGMGSVPHLVSSLSLRPKHTRNEVYGSGLGGRSDPLCRLGNNTRTP